MIRFVIRWFFVGYCVVFLSERVARVLRGHADGDTWVFIILWIVLLIANMTFAIQAQVRANEDKQVTRDPKG